MTGRLDGGKKHMKGPPVYRVDRELRKSLSNGKWLIVCQEDRIYDERIFEKYGMIEAAYVGFWPVDCVAMSLRTRDLIRIKASKEGERNILERINGDQLTTRERARFEKEYCEKGGNDL